MAFYMTTVEMNKHNHKHKSIGSKKNSVLHSSIKLVEASFGNYKVSDIYEDKDQRAEILNFGADNTENRLLILTGIKNRKGKRDKFITIYCLTKERIILHMLVTDPEIIGRLKSNMYNIVGGHIYYNNNVIKIRYDLIDANEDSLPENQLFDNYINVLTLQENDYV